MRTVISVSALKGMPLTNEGLRSDQVIVQQNRFGRNEFTNSSKARWWQILWGSLKDPMILLLFVTGTIFLSVGNRHEALTLYVAILPLLLMDLYLHRRTEISTEDLKNKISKIASVIRDNKASEINCDELVPGDLILLKTGDVLPADGYLESSESILLNESILTGESLPVSKVSLGALPTILNDDQLSIDSACLVYAGTRVMRGKGILRLYRTGSHTEYGMIIQSLSSVPKERTALQKSISDLVKLLTIAGLCGCVVLGLIRLFQGDSLANALLSAAIFAVAAMPEEFPIVFSFFLGVGVYRLAKKKALVKRAVTVESIGRVQCICTDKTGTMTSGELTLSEVLPSQSFSRQQLLEAAASASEEHPVDPVDVVISIAFGKDHLKKIKVFPFTEMRKKETAICKTPEDQVMGFSKGAPEVIFKQCELTEADLLYWRSLVSKYSNMGMKVIACARQAKVSDREIETEPVNGFSLLGILGFSDPLRPGVKNAIEFCQKNRIKVLMLTGDHPGTALAIASQAGMGNEHPKVLTFEDRPELWSEQGILDKASELLEYDVIARCNPLHKLWIVRSLRTHFSVVAVTGDGVNDVPAIQQADIGIAMGKRGVQSARDVASIVLADDNFVTIINAIQEGKQLLKNLNSSFEYLLLMQVPLVLGALIIPMMGQPLLFLPVHLVWLELILHPTSLLGFQMDVSKSKKFQENDFFNKERILAISLKGLLVCAFMSSNFFLALWENKGVAHARANALLVLILAGISYHLFKTRLSTRASFSIFLLNSVVTVAIFQVSYFATFLSVDVLSLSDWVRASLMVVLSISLSELVIKTWNYKS
ncbi:cation-transporting P-type ATPase [Bdellovibrio sp. KM01]|uniref:cation-translocating P-type ATPase n=1 Tax=Bdellovibrio sp. KM01 TaxID=2748865 RepID=UPI0015E8F9DD|nr:cation-transporting P-type ATPase [Bdellovibrio sp. KM01]QLY26402.1 cation-transporting P-type ATPase [Bdellovibrio sp. KM01]